MIGISLSKKPCLVCVFLIEHTCTPGTQMEQVAGRFKGTAVIKRAPICSPYDAGQLNQYVERRFVTTADCLCGLSQLNEI